MTPDLSEAEKIMGYVFSDKALLRACFTHSSYLNEHSGEYGNERLEFLGDAVLELVCSERLYFSGGDEGEMTERRRRIVSDETLRGVVVSLGLDKFLMYSGGKSNLGKKAIPSLLEAVIGGIYLDGGYEAAKEFALKHIPDGEQVNYIGKAQEYFQGIGKRLPEYSVVAAEGKDNDMTFTVVVKTDVGDFFGEGKTKKAARMSAAKKLCRAITALKN